MTAQALIADYLAGGSLVNVAARYQLTQTKAWLVIQAAGVNDPAKQSREARRQAYQTVVEQVARTAAHVCKVRIWQSSRAVPATRARFIVFAVSRELGCSFKSIARAFEMDHASVIHGCNRAAELAELDDLFAERLNAVRLICGESA